jgi:hypothetical protein
VDAKGQAAATAASAAIDDFNGEPDDNRDE